MWTVRDGDRYSAPWARSRALKDRLVMPLQQLRGRLGVYLVGCAQMLTLQGVIGPPVGEF